MKTVFKLALLGAGLALVVSNPDRAASAFHSAVNYLLASPSILLLLAIGVIVVGLSLKLFPAIGQTLLVLAIIVAATVAYGMFLYHAMIEGSWLSGIVGQVLAGFLAIATAIAFFPWRRTFVANGSGQ